MRVAMVSTVDDRCGIADYTARLSDALRARGVEVVVHSVDSKHRATPGFFVALSRELERAADVDVIHVQHEYGILGGHLPPELSRSFFARVGMPEPPPTSGFFEIARRSEKPLVVTAHELQWPKPPRQGFRGSRTGAFISLMRYVNRLTFATADVVIAHSDERRARLIELGIDPLNIEVVPLGIPRRAGPLPARDEARRVLGLADERVLLTFGFQGPRKGVELLIRAMESLPGDVSLLIAGGNVPGGVDHLSVLEREITARCLEARVRLLGHLSRESLDMALAAADVFALCPLEMGGGSASLSEAVSAGVPVVSWSLPQLLEIESRLNCMALATFRDERALVNTLRAVLDDHATQIRMRAKTNEASVRWSIAREAEHLIAAYRSAQETHRRERAQRRRLRWSWSLALLAVAVDHDRAPRMLRRVLTLDSTRSPRIADASRV
jgi:glycosyltransferase involved in cell wall biosynthesis